MRRIIDLIFTIILFLYLIVLSVSDVKSRKLPAGLLRLGFFISVFSILIGCFWGWPLSELPRRVMTALLGAVPGVMLIVLSYYSDKVGRGDGIVLAIVGITESCTFSVTLMFIACILLAVFSGIMMAIHKIGARTRMPYIPFLAGSYIFLKICEGRMAVL